MPTPYLILSQQTIDELTTLLLDLTTYKQLTEKEEHPDSDDSSDNLHSDEFVYRKEEHPDSDDSSDNLYSDEFVYRVDRATGDHSLDIISGDRESDTLSSAYQYLENIGFSGEAINTLMAHHDCESADALLNCLADMRGKALGQAILAALPSYFPDTIRFLYGVPVTGGHVTQCLTINDTDLTDDDDQAVTRDELTERYKCALQALLQSIPHTRHITLFFSHPTNTHAQLAREIIKTEIQRLETRLKARISDAHWVSNNQETPLYLCANQYTQMTHKRVTKKADHLYIADHHSQLTANIVLRPAHAFKQTPKIYLDSDFALDSPIRHAEQKRQRRVLITFSRGLSGGVVAGITLLGCATGMLLAQTGITLTTAFSITLVAQLGPVAYGALTGLAIGFALGCLIGAIVMAKTYPKKRPVKEPVHFFPGIPL